MSDINGCINSTNSSNTQDEEQNSALLSHSVSKSPKLSNQEPCIEINGELKVTKLELVELFKLRESFSVKINPQQNEFIFNFKLLYPDDARDKVFVAILKALILLDNRPSSPRDLSYTISKFGFAVLGGATPFATVSSRISQHFKRVSGSPFYREPVLGKVFNAENPRKILYKILPQNRGNSLFSTNIDLSMKQSQQNKSILKSLEIIKRKYSNAGSPCNITVGVPKTYSDSIYEKNYPISLETSSSSSSSNKYNQTESCSPDQSFSNLSTPFDSSYSNSSPEKQDPLILNDAITYSHSSTPHSAGYLQNTDQIQTFNQYTSNIPHFSGAHSSTSGSSDNYSLISKYKNTSKSDYAKSMFSEIKKSFSLKIRRESENSSTSEVVREFKNTINGTLPSDPSNPYSYSTESNVVSGNTTPQPQSTGSKKKYSSDIAEPADHSSLPKGSFYSGKTKVFSDPSDISQIQSHSTSKIPNNDLDQVNIKTENLDSSADTKDAFQLSFGKHNTIFPEFDVPFINTNPPLFFPDFLGNSKGLDVTDDHLGNGAFSETLNNVGIFDPRSTLYNPWSDSPIDDLDAQETQNAKELQNTLQDSSESENISRPHEGRLYGEDLKDFASFHKKNDKRLSELELMSLSELDSLLSNTTSSHKQTSSVNNAENPSTLTNLNNPILSELLDSLNKEKNQIRGTKPNIDIPVNSSSLKVGNINLSLSTKTPTLSPTNLSSSSKKMTYSLPKETITSNNTNISPKSKTFAIDSGAEFNSKHSGLFDDFPTRNTSYSKLSYSKKTEFFSENSEKVVKRPKVINMGSSILGPANSLVQEVVEYSTLSLPQLPEVVLPVSRIPTNTSLTIVETVPVYALLIRRNVYRYEFEKYPFKVPKQTRKMSLEDFESADMNNTLRSKDDSEIKKIQKSSSEYSQSKGSNKVSPYQKKNAKLVYSKTFKLLRLVENDYVNASTLLEAGGVNSEQERNIVLSLEVGRFKWRRPNSQLSGTWVPLSRARALASTCSLTNKIGMFLNDGLESYFSKPLPPAFINQVSIPNMFPLFNHLNTSLIFDNQKVGSHLVPRMLFKEFPNIDNDCDVSRDPPNKESMSSSFVRLSISKNNNS
ncbi:hypothetical protein BB560_004383 [Smittium megazygosporum]|uniref:HTH APSES-type domain-containing protein n=1 Tax=Smittium megazygosporum TaxID=133381 RepID=A0A2T9Z9K4_9FUNG|nr:hypothetical protein BB560_004383 [Smittium megazygosporum]